MFQMSRVPCHYLLQMHQADPSAHLRQIVSTDYGFMKTVAVVRHSASEHLLLFFFEHQYTHARPSIQRNNDNVKKKTRSTKKMLIL